MAASSRDITLRGLAAAERALRRTRFWLAKSRKSSTAPAETNDADEWNELYSAPISPVTSMTSPVARALEKLSAPGETLLEAGCGSAALSAELAVAGRVIELADFSQAILDRALRLFALSKLPPPKTTLADLTRPLPWADNAVDITWSSGVLEHWTDAELLPIVCEMARISRRRVIALVPNAASVFYRWGKWAGETSGVWPYGRELPRGSMRQVFESAGLRNVIESTVWSERSIEFLHFLDPETARHVGEWWNSLPADDPLRIAQGYLVLTVGSKA